MFKHFQPPQEQQSNLHKSNTGYPPENELLYTRTRTLQIINRGQKYAVVSGKSVFTEQPLHLWLLSPWPHESLKNIFKSRVWELKFITQVEHLKLWTQTGRWLYGTWQFFSLPARPLLFHSWLLLFFLCPRTTNAFFTSPFSNIHL